MPETYEINGKSYPVIAKAKIAGSRIVPVIDVKWMSDIKWQRIALEDRIRRPEIYQDVFKEDVRAVAAHLCAWLYENDPNAETFISEMCEKYGKEQAI